MEGKAVHEQCLILSSPDRLSEKGDVLTGGGDSLKECSREIDKHLEKVENELIAATEEELKTAEEDRLKMAALIKVEAERDIMKICDRRDERLRKNHNDIDKRRMKIGKRRKELESQLHGLGEELRGFVGKLKTKYQGSPTAEVSANLDNLLLAGHERNGESDCMSLRSGSVACALKGLTEQVSGIASDVTFMRQNGTNVGRVDGRKDRWVLEKEIKMPPVEVPVLKGLINEREVVIEDIKTSSIYVTNVEDKTTRLVIKDRTPLFNCASHDGSVIACGTKSGHVALYDGSWQHMRNLSLPGKFQTRAGVMCVAVDKDGRILIAQYGGNEIHIYHPSGSQWLENLDIDVMVPIHGIHILPSGIAVHSAMYGEQICILDKAGKTKSNVFLEESEHKCMSILSPDPWADSLYNLSCDSSSGKCVVEELCDMSSGQVSPETMFEFPAPRIANGLIAAEGFCVLSPDKMVACDGTQLLVYGKRRGVEYLRNIVS